MSLRESTSTPGPSLEMASGKSILQSKHLLNKIFGQLFLLWSTLDKLFRWPIGHGTNVIVHLHRCTGHIEIYVSESCQERVEFRIDIHRVSAEFQ